MRRNLPALSATLLLLLLGSGARAGRFEWRGGLELDGRRESFGFASIFDTGEVNVQGDSAAVRYRERRLEALALAGFNLRPTAPGSRNLLDLEVRAGSTRRSLTFEGAFARAGLTARNRLLADEDAESEGTLRSAQNLLQLSWSPAARAAWRPALRGAVDLAWADAVADHDTLAAVNAAYLRYRRASLGLGAVHGAYGETRLFLDGSRKWADRKARGSYEDLALDAQHGTSAPRGGWDFEARAERRRYLDSAPDTLDGALTSYREAEGYARWLRTGERWGWEASARVTGVLYDGTQEAPDSSDAAALAALSADRLQLETVLLARRPLLADSLGVARLECALGLAGDQLWVRESSGEYHALGVRLEGTVRAGPRLGEGWLEISAESGRRDYRGNHGDLGFDFEGLNLSLAQSDYVYLSGSVIGGGRIGGGVEWQVFAALDAEWHDPSTDDALLFSLDLTLLKRWGPAR